MAAMSDDNIVMRSEGQRVCPVELIKNVYFWGVCGSELRDDPTEYVKNYTFVSDWIASHLFMRSPTSHIRAWCRSMTGLDASWFS